MHTRLGRSNLCARAIAAECSYQVGGRPLPIIASQPHLLRALETDFDGGDLFDVRDHSGEHLCRFFHPADDRLSHLRTVVPVLVCDASTRYSSSAKGRADTASAKRNAYPRVAARLRAARKPASASPSRPVSLASQPSR